MKNETPGLAKQSHSSASAYALHCAFTLAELLMAILVISIIMVALAPVITRRAYDNVSIEVNKKKGLEVYTNPGIYTFDVPVGINTIFLQGSGGGGGGAGATYIDKSVSFTSNTTWSVPKGVSQLTFTISGSGGGGGAANGRANSGTEELTTETISKTACLSDEFLVIRGADDGRDFCITKQNLSRMDVLYARMDFLDPALTCTSGECCWEHIDNGIKRHACMRVSANHICHTYKMNVKSDGNLARGDLYRMPTMAEYMRMANYNNSDSSYLKKINFCDGRNLSNSIVTGCAYGGTSGHFWPCTGAHGNSCAIYCYHASEKDRGICFHGSYGIGPAEINSTWAASTRCLRPIDRYIRYSGSGGASGAKLQKTINVLPNDTLSITIGTGGNGGTYNSNGGKGSQGTNTQIIHKRGGVTMGTYYVKGGLGGNGASTGANGAAYTNGTSSSHTTPLGTCFAQFRTNTTAALSGGNVGCNVMSYSGTAGSSSAGGTGGRLGNEGTAVSGGVYYASPICNEGLNALAGPYSTSGCASNTRTSSQRNTTDEANKAKGQNATVQGFGGGGGFTPAWASGTGHFFAGGKGANGKVDITYRIALPGAGGGAATRVGGSKIVADENVDYEIAYKVEEGSRIMFEIGSGGVGGAQSQDGINGTPTIIGDNKLIFLAGQGGKTPTQTQKNNLSNCIGTTTNSTTITNCINNTSYKPAVGTASVINQNGTTQSSSYGLITSNGVKIKYTIAPTGSGFKGYNGKTSSQVNSSTVPWNYGFDGGIGGAPFGIRSNNIPAAVSCGGGIAAVYGSTTDANAYVCTSGSPDGNNARVHDPINNEFGGSGGAGGGAKDDTTTIGQGSNGSSGYLRIRWDESKNETWN